MKTRRQFLATTLGMDRTRRRPRSRLELGVPPPCAAQLPYNVALREHVERQPVGEALDRSGAGVVASFVLAGGVLSGKYDDPATAGRMRDLIEDRDLVPTLRVVPALHGLAAELDTTPAALAIVFALANERVSSVLFGATTLAWVTENIAAADLLARSTRAQLDRLRPLTV